MTRLSGRPIGTRYDFGFKVRVVKTGIEKGLTEKEIWQLYHVGSSTYSRWKSIYEKKGEEGLRKGSGVAGGEKEALLNEEREKLKRQVLDAKEKYPFFGVARLWQWVRRTMFLPISRRQVGETLREAGLVGAPMKRKRRGRKIRFFERARPNQLWQSDITTFTLVRGLQVYLIGFMDDHSRYLVGWGLYAGQSGALVQEVLRRAMATYGRPEEMLTDQGRQYKSWRGVTDFERELKQEGIKHITSRPHHPQTLGKIESFWGHLKREFLSRVVMGDLEDMRDRLKHWIQYYNFQRPHEGIGNVTPAERYFKYSALVKEAIEKQIAKNEEALAMRDPVRSELMGQVPLGDQTLEVRKEGNDIQVVMKQEENHEAQEESVGRGTDRGSAGEGESVAGAAGALGGEDGGGGMPGDGPETLAVLQTGREDGPGDGGSGETAGGPPKQEEPDGTDERPGSGDGGPSAGTPEDAKPDEDLAEAPESAKPETPEGPDRGAQPGLDGIAGA